MAFSILLVEDDWMLRGGLKELFEREGYEVTTYSGRKRANASVHAETYEARKDNYDNNTLLKALGGG